MDIKKGVNVIEKCLSNNSDLSYIEQYGQFLRWILKKYKINSLNDLYFALKKEWYAIPQNKLDRKSQKIQTVYLKSLKKFVQLYF